MLEGETTALGLFDSFRKMFTSPGTEDRASLSRKVQESPQDPQARQKLGLFLLRQGEIVEGNDQLARAAILYEKSGFTTKAIAVLRQMLKSDPSNVEFRRWIIRLLAQRGHTADAVKELQNVASGDIRFSTDDQRLEFYRQVSESLPESPLPLLLVADVFLYQRKLFEAVGEIEKAIPLVVRTGMEKELATRMNILASLSGDNPELLEPCGFLWIAAGKPEDGAPFLRSAADAARKAGNEVRGDDAERVLAALAEGRAGMIAGAASFEEALRKLAEPETPAPPAAAAAAEEDEEPSGEPQEGEDERILQTAVEKLQAKVKEEIGESDPEARYNLGIAYKEMGLLEEAAEEFRLSRSTESLFLGASILLSETLAEKGDWDGAIGTLDEVLASKVIGADEARDVRYQKAVLLSRSGKQDEAQEIFLSLYETSPDYRDLRERVGKSAP